MRVVIVDDHALFRIGLRRMLEDSMDCRVVGDVSSAKAAIAVIERELPDVVLLDLAMPEIDGVVAIGEIRRRAPRTRVLILSAYDQVHDVLAALNAGAAGYALKADSPDALLRALRSVAHGERYLAPSLAERMAVYEGRRRRAKAVLEVLSEREREIFRLGAACLLTREIAEQLKISRKTVDTHLYRIHRKLGLNNSAELVRLAATLDATEESFLGNSEHELIGHVVVANEVSDAPRWASGNGSR